MLLVRRNLLLMLATFLLMLGSVGGIGQGMWPGHDYPGTPHHDANVASHQHSGCDGTGTGSSKIMRDLCCVAACVTASVMPMTSAIDAVEWHLIALPAGHGRLLDGRSVTPLQRPPRPVA